jgi:hypothetical protein
MATMVRRKGVFAGIVTAVLGIAIALPFTLVHSAVPFAVLLIGFGLFMAVRPKLPLPPYPMAYTAGCLVALILLTPIVPGIKFAEQGFDDGPFYGVPYTGGVTGLPASDRIAYRQGELVIYNRTEDFPPILAYTVEADLRWALEMDIKAVPEYADYQLSEMADPT